MFYYYIKAFEKYSVFSGRASRNEFWYYQLLTFIIFVVLAFVDEQYNFHIEIATREFGVSYSLYAVFALIPTWAIMFRRLHDVGENGWIIIPWAFLPVIGQIYLIYLCTKKGDIGYNRFGPDPMIDKKTHKEIVNNDVDVKVQNEKKRKFMGTKWFPFKKKGVYRLYIVLSIIISLYFVAVSEGNFRVGVFFMIFMLVLYLAFVWIYNGFKNE